MNKESVIQGIAQDFVDRYNLDKRNVENFLKSPDRIDEIIEDVDNHSCFLMNYEDYKQVYIKVVLEYINEIAKKEVVNG